MSPSKVEGTRRGWIVPVGGAEDKVGPSDILRRFVEVSGGKKRARIAIIPTASSLEDTGQRYEKLFDRLGVDDARSVPLLTRADCSEEKWLEALEQATGIFVTGGNQLRLSSILGGTPAAKLIRKVNARGTTVGGTSAGAAILSEHMIASGTEGATPMVGNVTLAPGFGLTNKFIIDQHFRQRDRLGRLLCALAYNPFAVGIGLDEDTAAFIDPEDVLHVEGNGGITVVDTSELEHSSIASEETGQPVCMTNLRLHVLTAGATFNLSSRAARPPPEKR